MKRYLSRHVKTCISRPSTSKTLINRPSESQTYLAFRCLDSDFLNKLQMKEGIFNMRSDAISLVVKSEPIILSFGSFYSKRHRHGHLNKVTKTKLRELARLWINMKQYVSDDSFFAALKPENMQYFILSTKNITGYDHKSQEFKKAPSVALHMGTTLKQLCEHAYSELQQRNPMFTTENPELKIKQIKILRRLIVSNWNAEISSVANQNIMENQWRKPTIIPLTSDIKKLNTYVKALANVSVTKLKNNSRDETAFNQLQKCVYTLLITLNRRRVGELERLLLASYVEEQNNIISEEFTEKLSEAEKIILNKYKRIKIRGKRHKPVPVLISKEVQEYTNVLLDVRDNFVPKDNAYLFASISKNTCIDGYTTLRRFAQMSGAEYPESLTTGKLRKHVATISQLYNLDSSELEQLCSFLGHSMTTHQNFYRLPQEIYQTAVLAKHLLKSQGDYREEDLNTVLESEAEDSDLDDNIEQKIIENTDKDDNRTASWADDRNQASTCYDRVLEIKPKCTRVRWTKEQKDVTKEHFASHIIKKKPPTESEIKIFKERYHIMDNKDWKKIKAFVFNQYQLK
nr:unnamed protein product [Callosobruchus analis]